MSLPFHSDAESGCRFLDHYLLHFSFLPLGPELLSWYAHEVFNVYAQVVRQSHACRTIVVLHII